MKRTEGKLLDLDEAGRRLRREHGFRRRHPGDEGACGWVQSIGKPNDACDDATS